MFRIRMMIENPMTGESKMLQWQFDPAAFGQTVYAKTFAQVSAMVTELQGLAATSEPAKL